MTQKLNSFEMFWKELKRRKVVHVITVYAATAFVIMELVSMIARPLKLPEWTEAFVIVLLCTGFVIAVLLSWSYDITPAGVKKTKPVSAVKHIDQAATATSSGWKIATYVSAFIILALVAFNFISKWRLNSDITKLDKSIAVLPFRNDSKDTTNQYFINGIMEKITTNLQMVKTLRVLSRTSVEQYRYTIKSIPEIARELDVNYILEGSGQKYGNSFSLTVQLIKAKGKETHLWAKPYEEEINEVKDYIRIQSQIAEAIATELKTTIAPEEKQLIEKIPTKNMPAFDLYLKANNFLDKFEKNSDTSFYQIAVTFYKAALVIDPSFAKAYTGLAKAYYDMYQWETYFKESYLDSILIWTDKALSIDNQLDDAFYLKGRYCEAKGQFQEALDYYDKALIINPNYYSAYLYKGSILTWNLTDFVKCLDNFHKALNLIHGDERPSVLRELSFAYMDIGFFEKAEHYNNEAYFLDSNKVANLTFLSRLAFSKENIEESMKFERKLQEIDSTYVSSGLMDFGNAEEAYLIAEKLAEQYRKSGKPNLQQSHRIGYAFERVGKNAEAKDYFNQQILFSKESIKLDRRYSMSFAAQYDLAATYAFLGDKKMANKYLIEMDKSEIVKTSIYPLWWINYCKNDPLFTSVRNEEVFQRIQHNTTLNNQAEHERVKKWLEHQGML